MKFKNVIILFLLLNFLLSSSLFAENTSTSSFQFENQTDFLLGTQYRSYSKNSLSEYYDTSSLYLIFGEKIQISQDAFQFILRPELRSLFSPGVGLDTFDPASSSIQPPQMKLPFNWKLSKNNKQETYFSFEKAYLNFQTDSLEIFLGRRVLSFGVLRALPVWNRFSRPSPSLTGVQSLVYGRDSAGVRLQKDEFSFQMVDILGLKNENSETKSNSLIGEVTWYHPFLESHLLIAKWWKNNVTGVAFSKDIEGVTFRGESLIIQPPEKTKNRNTIFGAGMEVAFNATTSLLLEGLYQKKVYSIEESFNTANLSAFQTLTDQSYSFIQLTWKLSDLTTLSPSSLINLNDKSQLLALSGEYIWDDKTTGVIKASKAFGQSLSEFSKDSVLIINKGTIGYPLTLSAELKLNF